MAVNIGTLAAGIGSGIKNISTTIPTMQNQIQQAALRGAQKRDLDWNHQNAVDALQGMRDYYRSKGLDENYIKMHSAVDRTKADEINNIAKNMIQEDIVNRALGAQRGMSPVAQVAQAYEQIRQQATAYNNAPTETAPSAPLTEYDPSKQALEAPAPDTPIQTVAKTAGQPNVADFNRAMEQIGLVEGAFKGSPMYNNMNRQGVAQNRYIKDDISSDPELKGAAVAKDIADVNKKNAEAKLKSVQASRGGWNPNSGRGHGRRHHSKSSGPSDGLIMQRMKSIKQGNPSWNANQIKAEYIRRYGRH